MITKNYDKKYLSKSNKKHTLTIGIHQQIF